MEQRNSLSAYRFLAVTFAQFIIQVLLLPLVLILGNGDKAQGFRNTMALFAAIGTLCLLLTFFTTRERVLPISEQRNSVRQDVTDLVRNKPWLVMLALTILVFINLAMKGGMYIYYFKYYLDANALKQFLDHAGFNRFIGGINSVLTGAGMSALQWPQDAPTSAFSVFSAGGILAMIVGIGFFQAAGRRLWQAQRVRRRTTDLHAVPAGVLPVPAECDRLGLRLLRPARVFFYGITIPLLWAMIADVADYSEWKNHRRATAIIFFGDVVRLEDRPERGRRTGRRHPGVLRL